MPSDELPGPDQGLQRRGWLCFLVSLSFGESVFQPCEREWSAHSAMLSEYHHLFQCLKTPGLGSPGGFERSEEAL